MEECAVVLDLALVGTGGVLPLPRRWLASTLVRWGSHLALFDCGEGTQISLQTLGWGLKGIDLILLSHMHGDHVGGLPGLLLSQGNAQRRDPVRLVGPPGTAATVQALRVLAPVLPFELVCTELMGGERFEVEGLTVQCVAGDHAVPCLGYRLELPRQPRFLAQRAQELGVPKTLWNALQHGDAVEVRGRRIEPREVHGPARKGVAVALITDTRPTDDLVALARDVDLLVCEGTYGSSEDRAKAVERKHMTFAESAELARRAGVRRMVLTHFSPSVPNPEDFADEARLVFPNSVVGKDHMTFTLRFPSDDQVGNER